MATKEDILDGIANMTVLELSELLKAFESGHFGGRRVQSTGLVVTN